MSEPAREQWEITSVGEWLERRRRDITASRIAALWDEHPYISRAGLVDIMALGASGSGSSVPDNAAMRRGRIFEAACAGAVAEERPEWTLAKATTYHRLPDHRIGCTPDYWVGDDGLVQIKTTAPEKWDQWHGHPPFAYTLQTLTELLVTGRAWGCLACMVTSPSYPVYYFDVPRHPAAEARILAAAAAWWAAYDAGEIAPAAPSGELAAELDDGTYRDLSADNELPALLPERADLMAQRLAAEKRLDEIDYAIKNRMGSASTAWLPGWALTFRAGTRRGYTVETKTVRTLRVKAVNE